MRTTRMGNLLSDLNKNPAEDKSKNLAKLVKGAKETKSENRGLNKKTVGGKNKISAESEGAASQETKAENEGLKDNPVQDKANTSAELVESVASQETTAKTDGLNKKPVEGENIISAESVGGAAAEETKADNEDLKDNPVGKKENVSAKSGGSVASQETAAQTDDLKKNPVGGEIKISAESVEAASQETKTENEDLNKKAVGDGNKSSAVTVEEEETTKEEIEEEEIKVENGESNDSEEEIDFPAQMRELMGKYQEGAEKHQQLQSRILRQGIKNVQEKGMIVGIEYTLKKVSEAALEKNLVVKKGLCIIINREADDLSGKLRETYEKYRFQVQEAKLIKELIELFTRESEDDWDFFAIHILSKKDKETDNIQKLDLLKNMLSQKPEETPVMLHLQEAESAQCTTEEDWKVENTLLVRTNVPKFTKKYCKTLSRHGTNFDLRRMIQLMENNLDTEGFWIKVDGMFKKEICFTIEKEDYSTTE